MDWPKTSGGQDALYAADGLACGSLFGFRGPLGWEVIMPSRYVFVNHGCSEECQFIIFREREHRRVYEMPWPRVIGRETLDEMRELAKGVVSRLTELPPEARPLRRLYRRPVEPLGDFVIHGLLEVVDFRDPAAMANPKQAPTLMGLQLRTLDGRGECLVSMPHAVFQEKGLREGQVICLPEFDPQGYR